MKNRVDAFFESLEHKKILHSPQATGETA
jgi:hypothetical protein